MDEKQLANEIIFTDNHESTKQCKFNRGDIHILLLFLHENICCGLGASDEYPQHMFSCRNKKNISTFWM